MMLPVMRSQMMQVTHQLATCWRITCVNGRTIRVTDHDRDIMLTEAPGEDALRYSSAAGFNATARQRQAQLKDNNLEVVGIIDTDLITKEDLDGGAFVGAEVLEQLIDWTLPDLGTFTRARYWIKSVVHTGEQWQAQMEGFSLWLSKPVGGVYNRVCRHKLGDTLCKVDLTDSDFHVNGTVNGVADEFTRFTFTDDGHELGWYTRGAVNWTSGRKSGFVSEVRKDFIDGGNRVISLQYQSPYVIEAGDTFTLTAGCDHTPGDCKDKFDNFAQYGGFPFIPGNDRMMKYPNAK